MSFRSSSVTVVLNDELCKKEFQSLADLTGRHQEKADNAEMRPPGTVWQGLTLGGW